MLFIAFVVPFFCLFVIFVPLSEEVANNFLIVSDKFAQNRNRSFTAQSSQNFFKARSQKQKKTFFNDCAKTFGTFGKKSYDLMSE